MDLNNLKSNQELLISHMKKNSYSIWYISKINAGINKILKFAKDNEYYLDYYNRIIKPHVKNNKRNHNLEILTIIMNFDLYGKLPDKTAVKHKIIDNSNISLRNKAIVSLLLYTGLRACDVSNLKLNNIDWENEIIYIIQTKTDIPVELPLSPSVGNALYDYITNERPNVEISNIFIREDANLPIHSNSVKNAVNKVMNEDHVRMNNGDRRGTHIFRYHLASFLLEKNISQPVISSLLGHTSSSSLEAYLKADSIHLKSCALSIEPFERSVNT